MSPDEKAIRELVDRWWEASRRNDVDTVLPMIADDALFTVAGAEPFGKKQFEAQARRMQDVRMDGNTEILEVEVMGDRAWMRGRITVRMNGMERKGYVLSIFRKGSHGHWMLHREANLLTAGGRKGDTAQAGLLPQGETGLHGVDDI